MPAQPEPDLARQQQTAISDWAHAAPTETPAEPAGQPRDEQGRFVSPGAAAGTDAQVPSATPPSGATTPAEPATPAGQAATSETGTTPAAPPTPGASAQAIEDFIEARLNDQPYQLPKGIRLPLKRGEAIEYEPVEQVMKERRLERDYTIKMQKASEWERQVQEEVAAEKARLEARAAALAEQETMMREAALTPEGFERWQEHFKQIQENPVYRANVEAALRERESAAELTYYREREHRTLIADGARQATEWIEAVAEKYPGVDPERVRGLYSRALIAGEADLDPSHIERIFQAEATHLSASLSPLQQQVDALKAELAALKGQSSADQHNQQTKHALARAGAPPTGPKGGSPPAPAAPGPVKPFTLRELPDVNREWANRR